LDPGIVGQGCHCTNELDVVRSFFFDGLYRLILVDVPDSALIVLRQVDELSTKPPFNPASEIKEHVYQKTINRNLVNPAQLGSDSKLALRFRKSSIFDAL
jgi:hypothetical protein